MISLIDFSLFNTLFPILGGSISSTFFNALMEFISIFFGTEIQYISNKISLIETSPIFLLKPFNGVVILLLST